MPRISLALLTAPLLALACAQPDNTQNSDRDVPEPEQPAQPFEGEGEGEGEGEQQGEEGEGEGEGEERPPLDPAPGVELVGVNVDGTDCPSVTPAEAEIDAGASTSHTFAGVVTNHVGNGTFYVRGRNLEEIAGEIATPGSGDYSITLPVFCGDNVVKRVWSNDTCTLVVVTVLTTTDCVDADLRVTTVWDDGGRDWELHLVKPNGTINDNATDCTWTSCVNGSPDWGVVGDASDDPRKDVDWVQSYGPENIFLSGLEPGVYTVLVEHWSSSGTADSDGRVIINMEDKLVVLEIEDFPPHSVWTVARIHMPEGIIEGVGDVHDCSANWSGGCRDALP